MDCKPSPVGLEPFAAGESTSAALGVDAVAGGLDALLSRPVPPRRDGPARVDGVVIGELVDYDEDGRPLVTYPGPAASQPIPAQAAVPLDRNQRGQQLVLAFDGGNPERPIILGVLQPAVANATENDGRQASVKEGQFDIRVDDERVVLTAEREIVLSCGKASITLTRAGKVLIRGAYLLSRSSGVNRIKGGSVQIN